MHGPGLPDRKGLGGAARDLQRASALYEHACSAGDGLGCTHFATAHLAGWFDGADPAIGRSIHERECREGVAPACGWYATVLLEGLGGPADLAAATELAFDMCERKQESRSCFVAGVILLENPSSEADVQRGIAHFEFACNDGVQDACAALEQLGVRSPAN